MIQTIVNVLALTSFAVSAAVVGAGAYVYVNKDALIKDLLPIPELPALDADLPLPGAPGGEGVTELPVTMPSF